MMRSVETSRCDWRVILSPAVVGFELAGMSSLPTRGWLQDDRSGSHLAKGDVYFVFERSSAILGGFAPPPTSTFTGTCERSSATFGAPPPPPISTFTDASERE